jgi:membrane protein DedA with SNARE-associated domain
MFAKAAGAGLPAGLGAIAGLALMVPMEAGIPIPIPADLVELAVGARVAAGDLPLWIAVLAFEAVAVLGTTALFLAARGPGHALVARLGPRIGLTQGRLGRASDLIERRGRPMLAAGRATPGLRTVTVVAAGGSGIPARRALPALIIGSSIFLQLHLFLGYFLGAAAVHALKVATLPALLVFVALALGGIAVWLVRRGRRAGSAGVLEGDCPACLALAFLAERPAGLRLLVDTISDDAAAPTPVRQDPVV